MFISDSYWLKNAHIPNCLLINSNFTPHTKENLSLCDLKIEKGIIQEIVPASGENSDIDLQKGIILPCFVDVHTHLDKGHIWQRNPNRDGTFNGALTAVGQDNINWSLDDLYARMEFGLKCSYVHGTSAIRTHIDSAGRQADISLEVWQDLREKWLDKIHLQVVSLVSLDYFQTKAGVVLADKIAAIGGILGGVVYMNGEINSQLDRVFTLAKERGLDLDFHADENGDPDSICLQKIAETAIKHQFEGKILCGHCCSLAVQSPAKVNHIMGLVKDAEIGIVSLPMCNLYLQDRQESQTPFWRGVTKVQELKRQQIPVAFASDNCRDPFYGFGDHDMLEVFNQAVRIAHLDTPYGDWIASVTKTPAELMGLSRLGKVGVGLPADLVIFKARYFSELLSRPQSDRLVLRKGKQIEISLPDYAELDHLLFEK